VLRVESAPGGLLLRLEGAWQAPSAAAAEAALRGVVLPALGTVTLESLAEGPLDLAAASLLQGFEQRCREAGLAVAWLGERPPALGIVERYQPSPAPEAAADTASRARGAPAVGSPDGNMPTPRHLSYALPAEALGRRTLAGWRGLEQALVLLGRVVVALGRGIAQPRRLRGISIARHVYETGIQAIPIVALIAFLIAVIVAYIGAQQLRNFGGEIYVVDLITLSVLRELAVLLTAIIVAGRSGSAFAAELGAMRLNEEVDALEAMGLEPVEVLVLPRVLALVIAMPLLTIVADFMGLAGGAVLSWSLVDIPFNQFLTRMDESIAPTTFWAGLLKAPVFALLIALVGTLRGLQVRGSSRELGRLTTVAVVQGIFLVILADALFAVLYLEIDF
jgi:phospholipid/cholesterol/gamma-HCH transport system permease protein